MGAADATIMLAKMITKRSEVDLRQPFDELTEEQKESVQGWLSFFEGKYPLAGYLTDGVIPRSLESEDVAPQEETAKAAKEE